MASSAATAATSSTVAVVQAASVSLSTMDLTLSNTLGPPTIFNEFLKWYENRQNSSSTTFVAHSGISFARFIHSNSLGYWVLDSGAIDHITGNKSFFSSLSTSLAIYLPLQWLMVLRSHPMVLVLFISFLLCLLIMFFISLGHLLIYYLLVVSLVPLILLFLLRKILFVSRTGVRDG